LQKRASLIAILHRKILQRLLTAFRGELDERFRYGAGARKRRHA
jgi:hypothetical protein